MNSVYNRAKKDRNLAASILLPLIEFEFSFIAEDTPMLVQAKGNETQLKKVHELCMAHNWCKNIVKKGANIGFKLHKPAFREIYTIAGPFADPRKNEWAQLLLEREGMKGGYMGNKISTKEKIISVLKKNNRWMSIGEMCLALRLMPSTVRETLRELESTRVVKSRRDGKRILWIYGDFSLETLPEKTAG
jgi:DNA-binding transcriptional ArsR family regulator